MTDLWLGLRLLTALGVCVQAGALLVRWTCRGSPRLPFGEWLSLTFGFGVGAVTSEMLALTTCGVGLAVTPIVAPWGVAWLVQLWARRRKASNDRDRPDPRSPKRRWSIPEAFVFGALGLVVAALLFRAAFFHFWWWGAWARLGLTPS